MDIFGPTVLVIMLTCYMVMWVWPEDLPSLSRRVEPPLGDYKSITARD